MLYPHTGPRVVALTKLQRSLNAAARPLACPAPDGAFTTELAGPGSLQRPVGHDYRNVRLIPDRTFTGCSVSFVGCTPNEAIALRAVQCPGFEVQGFPKLRNEANERAGSFHAGRTEVRAPMTKITKRTQPVWIADFRISDLRLEAGQRSQAATARWTQLETRNLKPQAPNSKCHPFTSQ